MVFEESSAMRLSLSFLHVGVQLGCPPPDLYLKRDIIDTRTKPFQFASFRHPLQRTMYEI